MVKQQIAIFFNTQRVDTISSNSHSAYDKPLFKKFIYYLLHKGIISTKDLREIIFSFTNKKEI